MLLSLRNIIKIVVQGSGWNVGEKHYHDLKILLNNIVIDTGEVWSCYRRIDHLVIGTSDMETAQTIKYLMSEDEKEPGRVLKENSYRDEENCFYEISIFDL